METLALLVKQGGHFVQEFGPARYYHLRVTNRAAYPEAREVEVLLTRLDLRGPDGQPQPSYAGPLPLRWQHQEHYPKNRTIGRATVAVADLLFVQPGVLSLTPNITPLNFPSKMHGEQHFWMTVVARGLNGESKARPIRIDWDGQWHQGDTEMASHLIITVEQ